MCEEVICILAMNEV